MTDKLLSWRVTAALRLAWALAWTLVADAGEPSGGAPPDVGALVERVRAAQDAADTTVTAEPAGKAITAPLPVATLPLAIRRMTDDHGASVLSHGEVAGLQFFVMQAGGQTQTFLTTPDGYLISGQLYRPDGTLLLDTRRGQRGSAASGQPAPTASAGPPTRAGAERARIRTAIRQASGPNGAAAVWHDLGLARVIEEGGTDAPLVYVFADPACPYCHAQWQQLRGAVEAGRLRVRWVPVAVLQVSKDDIDSVLSLLGQPTAAHLKAWMTRGEVDRRYAAGADVRLALIRNNVLFKRLQANRVPALLYAQADGTITLDAGLSSLGQ